MRSWSIILLTAGMLSWSVLVAAPVPQRLQVVDSFINQLGPAQGYASPRWHNGYLAYASVDFPPEIKLLNSRTGEFLTTKSIAFSSAPYVRIQNVAVSNTGPRIAYSGIARDNEGRGVAIIGWISASGDPEFVVRAEKFAADHLSFAPDGTLWVLGRTNKVDVLQHFDAGGRQIQPYVEFPRDSGGTLTNFLPQAISMVAIQDRVGILRDGKGLWTEISTDGRILGEWRIPQSKSPRQGGTGIAMTPSGNVYLSMDQSADPKNGADIHLLQLNKSTGQWMEIRFEHLLGTAAPRYLYLFGAKGEDLVVETDRRNYLVVRVQDQ